MQPLILTYTEYLMSWENFHAKLSQKGSPHKEQCDLCLIRSITTDVQREKA